MKPDRILTPSRLHYRAGERLVAIEQDNISAYLDNREDPVWRAKSIGGDHLQWLAFESNYAYLLAYRVDGRGQFQGYVTPPAIRRLDLSNGQWLESLPASLAKDKNVKPGDVVSVLAGDGYVAVLTTLLGVGKNGEAEVTHFEVGCYRAGQLTPIWTKTIPSVGERRRPGAYLFAAVRPDYAESSLQHLAWLGDTLLICAEAVQPIVCLNRDTGTRLWQLERPWEFERGFIGPSVWQHYIARFALDGFTEDVAKVTAARAEFDKRIHCAIIGGPIVMPLNGKRGSDSHSIFIAVSKSAAGGFSGYTADCILYEFSDHGKPVAMLKLPQMVHGGRFQRQKDGVVWNCQNDAFLKVTCSGQMPNLGMGPGGPDCLLRTPWLRQLAYLPPRAWLSSGKVGDSVAFSDTHAFDLPAGGYVSHEDRSSYHFPLTAVDLRTGVERALIFHVPFQGELPEPTTNFRKSTEPGGKAAISTHGPHLLAVTRLRVDGATLEITLGMENWSGQLYFDLAKVEALHASTIEKHEGEAIQAWLKALADVNKPDKDGKTPLLTAAPAADARYVKALLKAGADPKVASNLGWTPLKSAACYGTAEVVQLLIDAGSDVNARDKNCGGQTVVMWAARSDRESKRKVQALVKAGADPKVTLENGWNALMSAASAGNIATVEELLASGMDVNVRSKQGRTPLMVAVERGRGEPEMLGVLLKAGADVNAKDWEGETVLIHVAKGFGTAEAMEILLEAGADPRAKDKNGRTALKIVHDSLNDGSKEKEQVLEKFLNRR